MSMPRNNLDDVLRKRPPTSTSASGSSSAMTSTVTASKTKFRAAGGQTTPARSKTLPAATEHGRRVADTPLSPTRRTKTPAIHHLSSDSPVAVSSDDSSPLTPPASYVPAKRASPQSTNDHPSKRLRSTPMPQKENVLEAPTGKARTPIRQIDFSQVASSSRTTTLQVASRRPGTVVSTPVASTLPVAKQHTVRHFEVNYEKLLDYTINDLEAFKSVVVSVRGEWLSTLHADPITRKSVGPDAQQIFRTVDNIFRDATFCADHLIQQREAGRNPSLPLSEWIVGPFCPAPLQTSAPSSSPLSRSNNLPSSDVRNTPGHTNSLQHSLVSLSEQPVSLIDTSIIPDSDGSDNEYWSGAEPTEEELQHLEALEVQPSFKPPLASSLFDSPPNSQAESLVIRASSASSYTMSSREPTTLPTDAGLLRGTSLSVLQGDALRMRLTKALNDVFHLPSFRPNQVEIMSAFMGRRDVFVLMPTGGGKSLCFQLPAVVNSQDQDAVTFVISPLKALMKDQIDAMQRLGVNAVLLSSDLNDTKRRETWDTIMARHGRSRACLAYITPEMLNMSDYMRSNMMTLWEANKIAGFIIDEAHCIQSWKTFRSSYPLLSSLRREYPAVPIMALTATANKEVQANIKGVLGIEGCKMFSNSFNRPNLRYHVRPKSQGFLKMMMAWIEKEHNGHSGIVYCSSRDRCEELAETLRENHFTADYFHARIAAEDKARVLREWQAGKIKIIVATIAFGMGIDKADVRFVIHADIPSSLSGYYQETGRAGRDGQPADCLLFWLNKDAQIKIQLTRDELGEEDAETTIAEIKRVVQYCTNGVDCRRVQVLAYFDEAFDKAACHGTCDNCQNADPVVERDVTRIAADLVKLRQELIDNVTSKQLIDIYMGKSSLAKSMNLADVQHKGLGKDEPLELVERTLAHLLLHGAFVTDLKKNKGGWRIAYIVTDNRKADAFFRAHKDLTLSYRARPAKQPRKKGKGKGRAEGEENEQVSAGPSARRQRNVRRAELPDDPIEEGETWNDDGGQHAQTAWDGNQDEDFTGDFEEPTTLDLGSEDEEVVEIIEPDEIVKDSDGVVDVEQRCYKALRRLRSDIERQTGLDIKDTFGDEQLQFISVLLPSDRVDFEERLSEINVDMDSPHLQFVPRFLEVVFNWRTAQCAPATSSSTQTQRTKPPSASQLHTRYEYRTGTSSKPSSRR